MTEHKEIKDPLYANRDNEFVGRLHMKPQKGGNEMKLRGTFRCVSSECNRQVPFQIQLEQSSRVEFNTHCPRCKATIGVTILIDQVKEQTSFDMIEEGQIVKEEPTEEDHHKIQNLPPKEEAKEQNAVEQLTNETTVDTRSDNESAEHESGDVQEENDSSEGKKDTEQDELRKAFEGI